MAAEFTSPLHLMSYTIVIKAKNIHAWSYFGAGKGLALIRWMMSFVFLVQQKNVAVSVARILEVVSPL